MGEKRTLLIVNLGTPDDPSPKSVGRYLREFLMDPNVIDKPFWFRFILVNLLIVPLRKLKAAKAYKKIWQKEGSPLKIFTSALATDLQKELGSDWDVRFAMRYGQPSLNDVLVELSEKNAKNVSILPLYPQETKSSSGTVKQIVEAWRQKFSGFVKVYDAFYNQSEFLDSYAKVILEKLDLRDSDRLLFSFHGLPERHIREIDPSGTLCLENERCCDEISSLNRTCYRAQCYETARQLAMRLALSSEQWTVAFQSRLGREPWIQPFSDHVLEEWYQQPNRRIFVSCPAFVSDCLETLEEIGIRARDEAKAKGAELVLLPALNNHPYWVQKLAKAIREDRWTTS